MGFLVDKSGKRLILLVHGERMEIKGDKAIKELKKACEYYLEKEKRVITKEVNLYATLVVYSYLDVLHEKLFLSYSNRSIVDEITEIGKYLRLHYAKDLDIQLIRVKKLDFDSTWIKEITHLSSEMRRD